MSYSNYLYTIHKLVWSLSYWKKLSICLNIIFDSILNTLFFSVILYINRERERCAHVYHNSPKYSSKHFQIMFVFLFICLFVNTFINLFIYLYFPSLKSLVFLTCLKINVLIQKDAQLFKSVHLFLLIIAHFIYKHYAQPYR